MDTTTTRATTESLMHSFIRKAPVDSADADSREEWGAAKLTTGGRRGGLNPLNTKPSCWDVAAVKHLGFCNRSSTLLLINDILGYRWKQRNSAECFRCKQVGADFYRGRPWVRRSLTLASRNSELPKGCHLRRWFNDCKSQFHGCLS